MKRIKNLTAEQLRKSILQLAIQGRFVPQNPSDGDAKDLLAEIKNEKAKLIKEGKIKKEKPLPEIKEDEKPFEIPESWCWCRFPDIVNFRLGKTPERANTQYWLNGKYNWFSISDMIDKQTIYNSKEKVSEIAFKDVYKSNITPAETLIMSFKLSIGRMSILGVDGFHHEGIISIFPYIDTEKTTRNYLLHTLGLLIEYIEKTDAIKGSTLNKEKISQILIPFPPLAEQKRIVEKIESLEPLLKEYEKREKALTELDDNFAEKCKKSILQHAIQGKLVSQDPTDEPASELVSKIRAERAELMKQGKLKKDKNESFIYKSNDGLYYEKIGKAEPVALKDLPFKIPECWVWIRLKTIADIFNGNSINEDEKRKKYTNIDGYDYIATKDVNFDKTINYANGVNIPHDTTFKIAPAGKVLLCIEGGSAGRKIAITDKKVCFGNKLVCFDTLLINDTFLFFILQSAGFLSIFKDSISGIIGGVSIGTLKEFLIPLPPLAEQKRIVAKIEEIFNDLDKIKKASE